MYWHLFKGAVFISFVFCMFSIHIPYTGLLFFLSLAVSALLAVRIFYPAAARTGVAAGMAVLLNMAVWFVFHFVTAIIQSIGFITFVIVIFVLFIAFLIRLGRTASSSYGNIQNTVNYPHYQNGSFSIDLYHGTPDLNNVRDILDYGSGFIVGLGNSHGTGVYFTNSLGVAKQYARGSGGVVMVNLRIPTNQVIDYNSVVNSPYFNKWCSASGNGNLGDNVTEFTIEVLQKRFIKADDVYIALARRTTGNERVAFEGLTILGGLDARGNPI